MPAPPCSVDCACGKHRRTWLHNRAIGDAVRRARRARGYSQTTHARYMRDRRRTG